ncbi:hypothetical protein NUW54_g11459 [Trametes sanguinea]|uniref:Uncharacterized protein n=1 Tax=Trametes sanguinea TaxID=158606 RepID=A0ACC1NFC3_9APHY|nr:hypothetical protein NUW54_g11459 [Trametes sanguinea]
MAHDASWYLREAARDLPYKAGCPGEAYYEPRGPYLLGDKDLISSSAQPPHSRLLGAYFEAQERPNGAGINWSLEGGQSDPHYSVNTRSNRTK